MDIANNCIGDNCCDCWKDGCGCNQCFGVVADCLETVNPCMEYVAQIIWCFGSPLAFPIGMFLTDGCPIVFQTRYIILLTKSKSLLSQIQNEKVFCFNDGPETDPPGGGWQLPMIQTPLRIPIKCCLYTACAPCGQWWMRHQLLDGDMTKYKLWQGYHDGPHCCANRCGPSAPITIEAGTYGESKCPHAFLAAEVCCLGCAWSVCCSFDVNRRMIKDQRKLENDPLENRVNHCVGFFSQLASKLCMCALCVSISSCCVGFCAPDSEGAQECSGEGGRAASACFSCVRTCWRGIWSVKIIAMGCMSSQMDFEMKNGQPLVEAPTKISMNDRGGNNNNNNVEEEEEEEDPWWSDPKAKK